TINPDGSFTYNAPDAVGTDVWQYTITDANGLTNPVPGYITFNVGAPETLPPVANVLTQGELDSIVAAARQRWISTGVTAGQLATLYQTHFVVANLAGAELARFAPNTVVIDQDAGGLGWFVDPTPTQDEEFTTVISPTRMAVPGTSPIAS